MTPQTIACEFSGFRELQNTAPLYTIGRSSRFDPPFTIDPAAGSDSGSRIGSSSNERKKAWI
jgi:hypothetical protein